MNDSDSNKLKDSIDIHVPLGNGLMSINNSNAYICGIPFDKTNRYTHPIESITPGERHPLTYPFISKAVPRNYTTYLLISLLRGHPVLKSFSANHPSRKCRMITLDLTKNDNVFLTLQFFHRDEQSKTDHG